jgi:hypothetical protein
MITDTITISVHDNNEWSIESRSEEPDMSVGGMLTDSQVIALFKEWVIEGPPSPSRVCEILDSVNAGTSGKVRVQ